MPFTPVHVVAALPFLRSARARKVLDPVALVIGAMAPDFDYFLHGRMEGGGAHSFVGVVCFAVPLTLVGWLMFHALLKWPLWLSLPTPIRSRIRLSCRGLPRTARILPILAAALAGAASHVAWDACTHRTGSVVAFVLPLSRAVVIPLLGSTPVYRLVQHASTLLGAVALAVVLTVWLLRAAPRDEPRYRSAPVATILPIAVAAGALAGVVLQLFAREGLRFSDRGHFVVAAIDGGLLGMLTAAVGLKMAIWLVPSLIRSTDELTMRRDRSVSEALE